MDPFIAACKNGDVGAIDKMYPLTNKKDQYNRTPTTIEPIILFKGFIQAIDSKRYQVVEALEKRGVEIPGVLLPPLFFTCASMDKDEVDNMFNEYSQDWSKMADIDPDMFISFYDSVIDHYGIDSHTVLSLRDQEGKAFLLAVVLQDNNEILQSLLDSGFDCDQIDLALYLKTACDQENMDIIETLINYMTISDLVYSFKTYGKCHDDIKKMVYAKFVSLVSETPSFWKKFDMNSEDTYYLYKLIGKGILNVVDSNEENLFHHLAREKDTETFQKIINTYAMDYIDVPNAKGNTPLMIAITNGNYKFVSLLILMTRGKLQATNKETGKSARDMQYSIKDGQTRLRMGEALRKW